MPKKDTSDFLKIMSFNSYKKESKYNIFFNLKEISNHLESISSTSRKNIFSDAYWNRYPKYIAWNKYTTNNPRAFGRGLEDLVKYIISNKIKYPKTYKSLFLNSSGIILNYTIKYFSGNEKLSLAKRGIKSNDPRVRKISARYLPTKYIEHLANDSDYGIRSIVANRVSPIAKPYLFLNSRNGDARIKAIMTLEMDRDTIFKMINEKILNVKDYYTSKEVVCLLDKLNDNDILFFVNTSGTSKMITDYFNNRLS